MNEGIAKVQPTEPNQETIDRFFSAYATFLQAFQPAWMATEVQQEGTQVYQEYMQVLQEAMDHEIQKRMIEAWKRYLAIMEKPLSAEELQANISEAYQAYLQSVQHVWKETDLKTINALTLAAISQSLSMASWLAAAATGVSGRLADDFTQSV